MDHLFFLIIWPTIAGLAAFVYCWKWEHQKLGTSILIGLGIAAGVLGIGLAMVAL